MSTLIAEKVLPVATVTTNHYCHYQATSTLLAENASRARPKK